MHPKYLLNCEAIILTIRLTVRCADTIVQYPNTNPFGAAVEMILEGDRYGYSVPFFVSGVKLSCKLKLVDYQTGDQFGVKEG